VESPVAEDRLQRVVPPRRGDRQARSARVDGADAPAQLFDAVRVARRRQFAAAFARHL